MYARIAKFEGADPAALDVTRERIESDMASGTPPEGLEGAKEVMLLVDREGGSGRRSGVEMYEVAFRGTPSAPAS